MLDEDGVGTPTISINFFMCCALSNAFSRSVSNLQSQSQHTNAHVFISNEPRGRTPYNISLVCTHNRRNRMISASLRLISSLAVAYNRLMLVSRIVRVSDASSNCHNTTIMHISTRK